MNTLNTFVQGVQLEANLTACISYSNFLEIFWDSVIRISNKNNYFFRLEVISGCKYNTLSFTKR